jgi:hypothetical protein
LLPQLELIGLVFQRRLLVLRCALMSTTTEQLVESMLLGARGGVVLRLTANGLTISFRNHEIHQYNQLLLRRGYRNGESSGPGCTLAMRLESRPVQATH